jgi:DNA ligase 1
MKFAKVAHCFEQIEHITGRTAITQLLAQLFSQASAKEVELLCNLCLGQLQPPYLGTAFNMAEKSFIPVAAALLGKTTEEIRSEMKKEGDIGSVLALYEWPISTTLSIEEVFEQLRVIEHLSGVGSQEAKAQKMIALLQKLDSCSAKYVARMVLGKLRLGFSDMTIIDALSWMVSGDKSGHAIIEEAYNICADLGLIGKQLRADGLDSLKKMTIHIGIPVRPAAAERLPTAESVIEKIGPCVAQPKLDGFRLQIHVNRVNGSSNVHFFSRHLQDMSAMFPDLVEVCAQLPVESIICEGEAIGYNPVTGDFLPFQKTAKRRRKYDIDEVALAYPLRVFLFDILYINGADIMHLTHEERRIVLCTLMDKVKTNKIIVIPEQVINTAAELENYFEQEIAAGLEGLVIKKPDAPYRPGKRNFSWIKLKRISHGHLEDTVDCVILGYYHGTGRRVSFGIGSFLVGVYNKRKDCFQTIAKVGTGLKDDQWKALKKECDKRVIPDKPRNVECAKELTPDVWIMPSLVCAIFADEITLSPLHTANKTAEHNGFALRFPRILGYREDKSPEDATQVHEIKRLYEDQFKS